MKRPADESWSVGPPSAKYEAHWNNGDSGGGFGGQCGCGSGEGGWQARVEDASSAAPMGGGSWTSQWEPAMDSLPATNVWASSESTFVGGIVGKAASKAAGAPPRLAVPELGEHVRWKAGPLDPPAKAAPGLGSVAAASCGARPGGEASSSIRDLRQKAGPPPKAALGFDGPLPVKAGGFLFPGLFPGGVGAVGAAADMSAQACADLPQFLPTFPPAFPPMPPASQQVLSQQQQQQQPWKSANLGSFPPPMSMMPGAAGGFDPDLTKNAELLRQGEELLRKGQELQRLQHLEMWQHQQQEFIEEDNKRREEEERELRQHEEELRRMDEERRKLEEETRKMEQERMREEQERLRLEATDLAKSLQAEMQELVKALEEPYKLAKEKAQPLFVIQTKPLSDEDIIRIGGEVEDHVTEARGRHKVCNDFMLGKHAKFSGVVDATRSTACQILKRVGELKKDLESLGMKVRQRRDQAKERKDREARIEAARKAREKEEKTFKQYDVDGDGFLNAEEMTAYAMVEFGAPLTEERIKVIFDSDAVEKGKVGTPLAKIAQLKTQVGIVLEEIKAQQRKLEREQAEKRAKEQIAVVLNNVKETQSAIEIFEAEVQKVEKLAMPLGMVVGPRAPPPEMLEEKADQVEAAVDAAKDFGAAATEQATALQTGLDRTPEPSVAQLIAFENRRLSMVLSRLEQRLERVAGVAQKCKDRIALVRKKAELMREIAVNHS